MPRLYLSASVEALLRLYKIFASNSRAKKEVFVTTRKYFGFVVGTAGGHPLKAVKVKQWNR
jgi:hypothetical protein